MGVVHYPHLAYLTSIGRLHGTHHRNLMVHTTAAATDIIVKYLKIRSVCNLKKLYRDGINFI